jgi:hypothetical protein
MTLYAALSSHAGSFAFTNPGASLDHRWLYRKSYIFERAVEKVGSRKANMDSVALIERTRSIR